MPHTDYNRERQPAEQLSTAVLDYSSTIQQQQLVVYYVCPGGVYTRYEVLRISYQAPLCVVHYSPARTSVALVCNVSPFVFRRFGDTSQSSQPCAKKDKIAIRAIRAVRDFFFFFLQTFGSKSSVVCITDRTDRWHMRSSSAAVVYSP